MKQIEKRDDIQFLVESFYDKVVKDDLLSPFFKHLNFDKHLPKMVDYWEFVLLDKAGYTTDVTQKHSHMHLKQEHFDRWLALFNETVDALFIGDKAELAKQRAFLVGWTIKSKQ
ncbi:MAG: group III truncated hemoglobin [Crocinitomicaceae bacterium]|nr:group III truncated hemoglobin [Flavobacteriales bacterium]NQZ35913.1 group III truncated hemoglobin [Crocinitomicaceae bacterium]